MLRSVLRNVQYYLLFFSILLVLLAFQRLQWYDQGLLAHPYALIDHPMQSMRGYTPSSPDNAGRVYYGGDESKEIGLFKFKLGLFKFILPTFNDDASWDRTNELSSLMMVPPPPNKRRKQSAENNMHLRLKAQSQMHSQLKRGDEGGGSVVKDVSQKSVAYVVVVPNLSKELQVSDKDDAEGNGHVRTYYQKVKVLSESIRKAHASSPYEYQLYALDLGVASNGDANQETAGKILVQSGFNVINVNEDEVNNISEGMRADTVDKLDGTYKREQGLLKLLNQSDVIVQISLGSFLLKPLDELFNALLKKPIQSESLIGVNDISNGSRKEEGREGEADQSMMESTQVDAFLVSPSTMEVGNDLVIFRSSSRQATRSYLKSLECRQSLQSKGGYQVSSQENVSRNRNHLGSPMIVARKNLQINPGSAKGDVIHCKMQVENSMQLDKCLYDAGNLNVDHDCTGRVRGDVKVAHFSEDSIVNGIPHARDQLEVEGSDDTHPEYERGHQINNCAKPWEFSSSKDCSANNSAEMCMWLCVQWFNFISDQ